MCSYLVGNAAVVELELTEHVTNGLGQTLNLQDCNDKAILHKRQNQYKQGSRTLSVTEAKIGK